MNASEISKCLNACFSSETDLSEIVAPVPRRHHILQTSESRHWLGTPPLSPRSRPISPLAATAASPTRRRLNPSLSFNSLYSQDGQRGSPALHSSVLDAQKAHKVDEEDGAAKRLLRWMHHENMRAWIAPCLILASIWVKWAVGLASYSGPQFIHCQWYFCSRHDRIQGGTHLPCMGITKHNGIGWSSPSTCLSASGIPMTSSIGVLTTPH